MNWLVHLNRGYPALYITMCSHSLSFTLSLCGHISHCQCKQKTSAWHFYITTALLQHLHGLQILRPINSIWVQCAASYPEPCWLFFGLSTASIWPDPWCRTHTWSKHLLNYILKHNSIRRIWQSSDHMFLFLQMDFNSINIILFVKYHNVQFLVKNSTFDYLLYLLVLNVLCFCCCFSWILNI